MTKHLKRILQSICLLQLPKIRDVIDRPAPSSSPLPLHDFSTGCEKIFSSNAHYDQRACDRARKILHRRPTPRWWGFAPTIAACYVLWWWGAIGSHRPAIHLQCRTHSVRRCGCVVLGRTTHDARPTRSRLVFGRLLCGCIGARALRRRLRHYQKTRPLNVFQFAFKLFNSRIQVSRAVKRGSSLA
ncbi:hypothetical protein pipiens_016746 [Culex pipiens pipiens]|uniref:Uncharacterized protein n=1 Tax=Culex pipiens pipiens TaxID=38569 RepID=A0ABD1CK11_CULPP